MPNGPKLLLSFDVAKAQALNRTRANLAVGSGRGDGAFQTECSVGREVHGGGHALTLQLLDVRQPTQQFGSIEDLGASLLPESLAKNEIVASYLYNF